MVRRPIEIVGYHQVQEPVTIVIEKCSAGPPGNVADPGFLRHVGKRPIAVIAIENICAQIRHINVNPPVSVVITAGASHSVSAAAADPGPLGNVLELPVPAISKEAVPWGIPESRIERAAVDTEHIQQTVMVIVQQSDASGLHLRNVKSKTMSGTVFEGQVRAACHFFEPGGGRLRFARNFIIDLRRGGFRLRTAGEN